MNPLTPVDGRPWGAGLNVRPGSPCRWAKPAWVRYARPVRGLDRAEELLLEPIGGNGGELFVGLGQRRQRDSDVVDRLGERVEQLLPGVAGDVGHPASLAAVDAAARIQLAVATEATDARGGAASRFSGRTAWARNLAAPVRDFLSTETGGALALLAATVAALVWANSPWSHSYESVWTTKLSIRLGELGHLAWTCATGSTRG